MIPDASRLALPDEYPAAQVWDSGAKQSLSARHVVKPQRGLRGEVVLTANCPVEQPGTADHVNLFFGDGLPPGSHPLRVSEVVRGGDMMTLTVRIDPAITLPFLCCHCWQLEDEHVQGKCLFNHTMYAPAKVFKFPSTEVS